MQFKSSHEEIVNYLRRRTVWWHTNTKKYKRVDDKTAKTIIEYIDGVSRIHFAPRYVVINFAISNLGGTFQLKININRYAKLMEMLGVET